MTPLVSILIPAYNAERTIAQTLCSAIAQTWKHKEILVVDDGSTDRTAEIAAGFASQGVTVISTKNQGISAAVNHAYRVSRGDYIQELDADDILTPDKIERQIAAALQYGEGHRVLFSSQWAPFYYRTDQTRFVYNSLCQDLSPVEWLLRKMGENLHMQNATWLVSRKLAEAAGPWDSSLKYDQDGEYYCRVLLASEGTCFVPGTGVFYRNSGRGSISYLGHSNEKKDSLLISIKLHIKYLRSLEESQRVHKACLAYLQTKCIDFYPERPDILGELEQLAAEMGGHLELPRLRWKYVWMKPLFGWQAAKWAQVVVPQVKASLLRSWDKAMFNFETSEQMRSGS